MLSKMSTKSLQKILITKYNASTIQRMSWTFFVGLKLAENGEQSIFHNAFQYCCIHMYTYTI